MILTKKLRIFMMKQNYTILIKKACNIRTAFFEPIKNSITAVMKLMFKNVERFFPANKNLTKYSVITD